MNGSIIIVIVYYCDTFRRKTNKYEGDELKKRMKKAKTAEKMRKTTKTKKGMGRVGTKNKEGKV